jgi:hypothetical protein
MKEIDIDKYRAAWKSEQSFEKKLLSEEDIQSFLMKKSREINKLFRKGLLFDIGFKSTLGISFIMLCLLFSGSMGVIAVNLVLITGIVLSVFFQSSVLKKVSRADYAGDNLRMLLEKKINFSRDKYIRSLHIGALSNPLFVINGMLYYFYFKYGKVRPFDIDDYMVLGLVIIIAFVLGAFFQVKHHNFHIRQLEQCLSQIDEHTINQLTLRDQRIKRRNRILVFILAIICGLLLLAYFLASAS